MASHAPCCISRFGFSPRPGSGSIFPAQIFEHFPHAEFRAVHLVARAMLLRPRGGFVQRRAIEQRGQHPLRRAPLRRGRLLFRRQRRKIEHHRIFALIRLGIGVERGDDFRGQAAIDRAEELYGRFAARTAGRAAAVQIFW